MSAPDPTLVLVTGASGFLGLHLVRVLTAAGARVRSLGRSHSARLEAAGVEQVLGSVTEPADVTRALEGVAQVYHLAGAVTRDKHDAGPVFQVHVRGTQTVLQGCLDAGIDQVLVLSTSGTIGVSTHAYTATEADDIAWDIIKAWPYYESKAYAEREVARFVKLGLPVKMARPTLLLGPGDYGLSSTGDVVKFLSGKVTAALPGGVSFVDVRDVAEVLPRVMADGRPGVGYLLGAANMSVRGFMVALEQVSGVRAPAMTLPKSVTDKAGGLLKWVSGLKSFGGLEAQTFEMGCHWWWIDSGLAARELGWAPRGAGVTLGDTVGFLN